MAARPLIAAPVSACAALVLVLAGRPGAALDSATAAARTANRKIRLICLDRDGSEYRRKEQPSQCAILGKGGIFAGGVNLKRLKWRGWGHARAKATGIECGFHLPCEDIRAEVQAWRPRERCGKVVYTRFKATSKYGSSRADVQSCPGPAFKAASERSGCPERFPLGGEDAELTVRHMTCRKARKIVLILYEVSQSEGPRATVRGFDCRAKSTDGFRRQVPARRTAASIRGGLLQGGAQRAEDQGPLLEQELSEPGAAPDPLGAAQVSLVPPRHRLPRGCRALPHASLEALGSQ
jgi:hypothetical protein